ncbi:hypothetical protein V8G54_031627 [Vigna mungo]|uniref:Uncharacterized protein n=1 Tax=Vigna mungo TaxID=3915 RepID=A0AAQ3MKG6_VIGMU
MKNHHLFFTFIICIMNWKKAYIVLIALELTCVEAKYGNSKNNPFQRLSPSILLFFLAMFSHLLALNADMNLPSIIITFHVSGLVASEALLWIFLTEFFHYYIIINLLLFLLASFCFFNHIVNITQLLCEKVSSAVQMPNMESDESQV